MVGRPRKNAAADPKDASAKKETGKRGCRKAAKATFRLTLTNEQARNSQNVAVAGEFNSWDKEATPMTKTLEGFEVELNLEKGRKYQFRYVLDGATWINDPYRPTVDNGMGEQNSVLDATL